MLTARSVGRIAVIVEDGPVVVPVNYRLVEPTVPHPARGTRYEPDPATSSTEPSMMVAFEIDSIDTVHEQGWSVLVRGTLQEVDPDAEGFRDGFSPQPWLEDQRDAWLLIEPFAISGRRLDAAETEWGFHIRGYL